VLHFVKVPEERNLIGTVVHQCPSHTKRDNKTYSKKYSFDGTWGRARYFSHAKDVLEDTCYLRSPKPNAIVLRSKSDERDFPVHDGKNHVVKENP